MNQIARNGRIFLTGTKIRSKTALGICFINHHPTNTDIDYLTEMVSDIAKQASVQ